MRKIFSAAVLLSLILTAPAMAAPSVQFSMDEDGIVWREDAAGSGIVASARPRDVTFAPGSPGARPLRWAAVDPSISHEMEGAEPGIWVFDLDDLERAPIFIPMERPMQCYDVCADPQGAFLIVCALPEPELTVWSLDGERQASFPGFGPLFWIDDYRFLYTSCVPGTARGGHEDADPWKGAAVMQVLYGYGPFDVSIEPIAEPTATADYDAVGIDEDGQCIILERSVASPEEWDAPEPDVETKELRLPQPAAG